MEGDPFVQVCASVMDPVSGLPLTPSELATLEPSFQADLEFSVSSVTALGITLLHIATCITARYIEHDISCLTDQSSTITLLLGLSFLSLLRWEGSVWIFPLWTISSLNWSSISMLLWIFVDLFQMEPALELHQPVFVLLITMVRRVTYNVIFKMILLKKFSSCFTNRGCDWSTKCELHGE